MVQRRSERGTKHKVMLLPELTRFSFDLFLALTVLSQSIESKSSMTLGATNKDENTHISRFSILFGRFSEEFRQLVYLTFTVF